jgi:hypothetical protein
MYGFGFVDIILVGKAVARRAQELLCEQNVAVMQNVKAQLLDRIRFVESLVSSNMAC